MRFLHPPRFCRSSRTFLGLATEKKTSIVIQEKNIMILLFYLNKVYRRQSDAVHPAALRSSVSALPPDWPMDKQSLLEMPGWTKWIDTDTSTTSGTGDYESIAEISESASHK